MTFASSEAHFQAASQAFIDWLPQQNITLSEKIKLVDLRERHAGRGVVAVQDISEDEELFSIPRTAILTPSTSRIPRLILSKISDNWLALILTLVWETSQQSSAWQPYLDLLPPSFDTLMFWSDAELAHLKGTAVVNKIGKEKANKTFTTQIIPVIREHAEHFDKIGQCTDEVLLSLCHRMGSSIMAYAFDIERAGKNEDQSAGDDEWEEDDEEPLPVGMIPMADMLNADADRNNAKLYYEEDRVVMRSLKHIAATEEMYNDYGAVPNADLARRYGYVTPNYSQYDVVEVSQELVREVSMHFFKLSEAEIDRRLQHLEAEMPVDAFDISHPDADAEDGPFSIELLAVLRCMANEQAVFDKMVAKGKMPSDKPLSADDANILEALRQIIISRSKDYSPEQDVKIESQTHRFQMARMIIRGERQVLFEAETTIQAMIGASSKKRGSESIEEQHQKQKKAR